MQNFSLNSVFLDAQVYAEIAKLLRSLDILQEFFDSLETISWVTDLIVL